MIPMMLRSAFHVPALLALFLWVAPATTADESPADPAARQIAIFHDSLLNSMKRANQLGVAGRYRLLKPVLEQTFDFRAMTAAVVGIGFDSYSDGDKRSLEQAFERMTIATYARNFDDYSGQRFTMSPNVAVRGDHKLVQTTLVTAKEAHAFSYVMHPVAGSWKVIDILLEGYVSQMATKRSEYAATLAQGGPAALVSELNQISDRLMAAN